MQKRKRDNVTHLVHGPQLGECTGYRRNGRSNDEEAEDLGTWGAASSIQQVHHHMLIESMRYEHSSRQLRARYCFCALRECLLCSQALAYMKISTKRSTSLPGANGAGDGLFRMKRNEWRYWTQPDRHMPHNATGHATVEIVRLFHDKTVPSTEPESQNDPTLPDCGCNRTNPLQHHNWRASWHFEGIGFRYPA